MASLRPTAADLGLGPLPRTNWGAKVSPPPPAPSQQPDKTIETFVGEHAELVNSVASSSNAVLKNRLTRAMVLGYLAQAITLYRAHESVVNASKEEGIEDTRIGVAVAIYGSMHIGFSVFIGTVADKEYTEENPGDTLAQVATWLGKLTKQFEELGAVIERAAKEEYDK